MRLAGFLLLFSGWIIVLADAMLLKTAPSQAGFLLAALGVEGLGLVLAFRSRLIRSEGER